MIINSETIYADSFKTQKLPYVTLAPDLPDNSTVSALMITNDSLSNDFKFPQTPDGIGAIQLENGTVSLFINHELENDTESGQDGFAKVSKLTLNQSNLSVINGTLIINGTEGYEALCSSYLVDGKGFIHPVYFTNEETNDGLVLSIDVVNNTIKELPWLGKFSHENTIPVPYFDNTINKTVMLEFEDGDPTESEVYM
jgi:secreted PhoX family phosphatase